MFHHLHLPLEKLCVWLHNRRFHNSYYNLCFKKVDVEKRIDVRIFITQINQTHGAFNFVF